MTDSEEHRNDERTVRCPVEGCEKEVLARGLHLHIRRSSGNGHGASGEMPADVALDDAETVGEQEVTMEYPTDRDNETVARLCPYCSQPFTGHEGVSIHLGQVAGRKNHPADAAEKHDHSDFPRVELDEKGNIQRVFDDTPLTGEDSTEKGMVPAPRVSRLIAELVAEGEAVMAHRLRKNLLGIDNPDRPLRGASPYPDVYGALLKLGYEEESDQQVAAAVEREGILIACRGESALYSADEALDLAASLEQEATHGDWGTAELRDFVGFLRYATDLLEGATPGRDLHEEFQDWR